MSDMGAAIVSAVIMGLGATLAFDLWGLLLQQAFGIAPSNICLVGRWLRGMPGGTFRHANIAAAPRQPGECAVGWMAHYSIGVMFAAAFVTIAGGSWLQHPTLLPAVAFGAVTVVAPFALMQPAMGLGVAASKAANPAQARLRSLMNHVAFGAGLYWFGLVAGWLV
jgi:hypothetical protein